MTSIVAANYDTLRSVPLYDDETSWISDMI